MVKKIFWQDPYLTELNTIVHSVNGNQVTLSETIFYAFSGGQESDAGSIAGHPVLEARKEVKQIFYTLPEVHGLNGGDPVKIKIDWGRRYKLMRLHFAAEVVLELVCQQFPTITKVGAHIAQDKARIDFEWGESFSSVIPLLQTKVGL